jgi:type 1 fimbria pilin
VLSPLKKKVSEMFELKSTFGGWRSGRMSHIPRLFQFQKLQPASKSIRLFLVAAFLLITGLVPPSAQASITCNNLSGTNQLLSAGTISVPANTAPGTTISTLAPVAYTYQCRFVGTGSVAGTLVQTFTTTSELAYGTDVYPTSIAGVGVRYIFNAAACNANNVTLTNRSAAVTCSFSGPLDGPYVPVSISVTAQLVVTGPIQGGVSRFITVPTVTITGVTSDNATVWSFGTLYTGSASGTLTQSTCSVTQSNTYVPLATADTRAFAAGTGTVFAPTPFSLTFACSAGAKVSITLTDNVNPANRSNTLQLTSDSSARGVGIQVLNSSGPVPFGPDSSAPGNTNQWLIGDSPSGQLQVPLTARYISTGLVSAGTVKALATFTLSYQ